MPTSAPAAPPSPPPAPLCCELTGLPFAEPVLADDGWTYERDALELWVDRHGWVSPRTLQPLGHAPVPNSVIRRICREWRESRHSERAEVRDAWRQNLDCLVDRAPMRRPVQLSDGFAYDLDVLPFLLGPPSRSPWTQQAFRPGEGGRIDLTLQVLCREEGADRLEYPRNRTSSVHPWLWSAAPGRGSADLGEYPRTEVEASAAGRWTVVATGDGAAEGEDPETSIPRGAASQGLVLNEARDQRAGRARDLAAASVALAESERLDGSLFWRVLRPWGASEADTALELAEHHYRAAGRHPAHLFSPSIQAALSDDFEAFDRRVDAFAVARRARGARLHRQAGLDLAAAVVLAALLVLPPPGGVGAGTRHDADAGTLAGLAAGQAWGLATYLGLRCLDIVANPMPSIPVEPSAPRPRTRPWSPPRVCHQLKFAAIHMISCLGTLRAASAVFASDSLSPWAIGISASLHHAVLDRMIPFVEPVDLRRPPAPPP